MFDACIKVYLPHLNRTGGEGSKLYIRIGTVNNIRISIIPTLINKHFTCMTEPCRTFFQNPGAPVLWYIKP